MTLSMVQYKKGTHFLFFNVKYEETNYNCSNIKIEY